MNPRIKVVTIVGTRPEIIRLSRVLPMLDATCHHILVHTGQNYDFELNEIFFQDLSLRKPDVVLEVAGKTAMETIAKVLVEVEKVLMKEKPDAVLVLGDTNSCLSILAAKRLKIPTFHMEAGNRCFDDRVPEEINRRIVDHTSDVNLPYSDIARDYLISEGIPADRIVKTGSPMAEVLDFYKEKIEASQILDRQELEQGKYFLVSCHREENIEDPENLNRLMEILDFLASKRIGPVLVSTHPRLRKNLGHLVDTSDKEIKFLKPLGFTDYVKLQINAATVLSDSGTISEESSILDFPAINIRETHERPESMEEGNVIFTGLDLQRIQQGLRVIEELKDSKGRKSRIPQDYQQKLVSYQVMQVILSYTNYVNSRVWRLPWGQSVGKTE